MKARTTEHLRRLWAQFLDVTRRRRPGHGRHVPTCLGWSPHGRLLGLLEGLRRTSLLGDLLVSKVLGASLREREACLHRVCPRPPWVLDPYALIRMARLSSRRPSPVRDLGYHRAMSCRLTSADVHDQRIVTPAMRGLVSCLRLSFVPSFGTRLGPTDDSVGIRGLPSHPW